jgi:hypothetical protein
MGRMRDAEHGTVTSCTLYYFATSCQFQKLFSVEKEARIAKGNKKSLKSAEVRAQPGYLSLSLSLSLSLRWRYSPKRILTSSIKRLQLFLSSVTEDSRQKKIYRTRLPTLCTTPKLEDWDFLLGLSPPAEMSEF